MRGNSALSCQYNVRVVRSDRSHNNNPFQKKKKQREQTLFVRTTRTLWRNYTHHNSDHSLCLGLVLLLRDASEAKEENISVRN